MTDTLDAIAREMREFNCPSPERVESWAARITALSNQGEGSELQAVAARLAVERAEYRRLCVRMAQTLEMVRDAEEDERSESRSNMPDGPLFAINRVLADYAELEGVTNV